VLEWHKGLPEGRGGLEDDMSFTNLVTVKTLLRRDNNLGIRVTAE
jgi:hypothetical protein